MTYHHLPEIPANTRVREEVTPHLVRHYSGLEMLDQPLKQGREARYSTVICYKCCWCGGFTSRGYAASAINQLATSKDNTELEALLQGGVHLTVTPANPALWRFCNKFNSVKEKLPNPQDRYSKINPSSLPGPTQTSHRSGSMDST